MYVRTFILASLYCLLLTSLTQAADNVPAEFVTVEDGHFMLDGKPYYFIGTNYWYGPLLASPGDYGDRERLAEELDMMVAHGITNLRILSGAQGPNGQPYRVTPALQQAPGEYDEELLEGLDYLMAEMAKRNMKAVLYLHNTWEWSGGNSQYLVWNGKGEYPYPQLTSWPEFMGFSGRFYDCPECIEDFEEHVRTMMGRTNQITGVRYTEDPTIMSWQIANEPRALSTERIPQFEKWVASAAKLIKQHSPNQLVSTGNEGAAGCEWQIELFERLHADPNVDYCTMHVWPKNWGWLDIENIPESLASCIEKTNDYIDQHTTIAKRLGKPIVLSEFGFPRESQSYALGSATTSRDKYYENIFQRVVDSKADGGVLAGCNFWTFGGTGRPSPGNPFWSEGEDYLGDPPQEEQGLNSVFDVDTTMPLIKEYNQKLSEVE